ncbi:MAG: MarC family protein [Halobacteriovoraceae bacterium]|nr:MarC family protein [Halobacteriovoraceae bacterium]
MFFLLNPLFMSIYFLDFFKSMKSDMLNRVLFRGAFIAFLVFCLCALVGDRLFTDVLHARFLSFQVFGGLILLTFGYRMVFEGNEALTIWREKPDHIVGAIAMPFFIGPGTIMAAIVAGTKLSAKMSILSISIAMISTVMSIVFLKKLYDHLNQKNEKLVQAYINITGRVMALAVGTFAIEMILSGLESWIHSFKLS